MNIKKRLEKLEQTAINAVPPEPAHIVFIPKDVASEEYKRIQADIDECRANGQTVIVFTVKDGRLHTNG